MELVPAVDNEYTNNPIQVSLCDDSSVVNTEFGGENHFVAVNGKANGGEGTQQHHGKSCIFKIFFFSTEYIACSSPIQGQPFERIRHSTNNSDGADPEEVYCIKTLSFVKFYAMHVS